MSALRVPRWWAAPRPRCYGRGEVTTQAQRGCLHPDNRLRPSGWPAARRILGSLAHHRVPETLGNRCGWPRPSAARACSGHRRRLPTSTTPPPGPGLLRGNRNLRRTLATALAARQRSGGTHGVGSDPSSPALPYPGLQGRAVCSPVLAAAPVAGAGAERPGKRARGRHPCRGVAGCGATGPVHRSAPPGSRPRRVAAGLVGGHRHGDSPPAGPTLDMVGALRSSVQIRANAASGPRCTPATERMAALADLSCRPVRRPQRNARATGFSGLFPWCSGAGHRGSRNAGGA